MEVRAITTPSIQTQKFLPELLSQELEIRHVSVSHI